MTFKSAIWYPIAVGLSVINVAGAAFAAVSAEPLHATVHVALAAAFWLWAQRLRHGPGQRERRAPLEAPEALEALGAEMGRLREELSETQERLDFAERLLAQRPEARRTPDR